jgi:hypothetical protein
MEKGRDAPPSVQRGLVVGDASKAQKFEPEMLLVVHERVPKIRQVFSV